MHDFCEVVVGQPWHIWWLANHRLCHGWPTTGWPTSDYVMLGQPVVGQLQVGQPIVGQLLVGQLGWDTQSTYMIWVHNLRSLFTFVFQLKVNNM